MATLEARIEFKRTQKIGNPITLTFSIRNNSDQELYFLPWNTPAEGLKSNCFNVYFNNKLLPYDGPRIKRLPIEPRFFKRLEVNEIITKTVELESVYPILEEGTYQIELNCAVSYVKPSGENLNLENIDTQQTELTSERDVLMVRQGTVARKTMAMIEREKQSPKKKVDPLQNKVKDPVFKGGESGSEESHKISSRERT